MFDLHQELIAIAGVLDAAGIPYAVCGGMAVAIHGCPRATIDLDMLIEEKDLELALQRVEKVGYTLPSGIIPFRTGTPNASKLSRVSKAVGEELLTLDLLLVAPVYEPIWNTRGQVEVENGKLWVVSRDGLIKMKTISGRPQDLVDIQNLESLPPDGV